VIHRILFFLSLISVFLLSACATPQRVAHPNELTFEPLKFQVPDVDRMELQNGIRLYLMEDHELPLVQVTAMMGAGSISVPVEKTGLGGLFGALLRTGGAAGRTPSEVDEVLELLAADLSVGTDTYVTTFNLSTHARDLEKGMAVLADLIRRPGFDPDRLEIARNQAIEGVRRQNDNPDSIASRALIKAIYGNHPLGRTPSVDTLNNIVREDLLAFHKSYFHPNNLWLAVSGDFDRKELRGILEDLLGDWSAGPLVKQKIPPVNPSPGGIVLTAQKDVPQTTILIGDLGLDKSDPGVYAVRVMNYILGGGGFNSRLMREIRSNRGLAYSVYSYFQIGRRLPGPFIAGSETKTASTLEVVRLMQDAMEQLRAAPVSEQELSLARESMIHSFVFAFTDTHDVVTQTMRLDYYDYPEDYLEKYRDRIAGVTKEDVLSAARRFLQPENQKVVLVGDLKSLGQPPESLGLPVETIPDAE